MPGVLAMRAVDDGVGFEVDLTNGRTIRLRKNNIPGNVRNSGDRQLIEDWINAQLKDTVATVISQTAEDEAADGVDPDVGRFAWDPYLVATVRTTDPLLIDFTVGNPRTTD